MEKVTYDDKTEQGITGSGEALVTFVGSGLLGTAAGALLLPQLERLEDAPDEEVESFGEQGVLDLLVEEVGVSVDMVVKYPGEAVVGGFGGYVLGMALAVGWHFGRSHYLPSNGKKD